MGALNITNITIEVTLGVRTSNQLDWTLLETSVVSVGDVEFRMDNGLLNWVLSWFHGYMMEIVNANVPMIE
jgi:hypothetical protein